MFLFTCHVVGGNFEPKSKPPDEKLITDKIASVRMNAQVLH